MGRIVLAFSIIQSKPLDPVPILLTRHDIEKVILQRGGDIKDSGLKPRYGHNLSGDARLPRDLVLLLPRRLERSFLTGEALTHGSWVMPFPNTVFS